ncbi:MAG: GGDEF domain-containing protein [Kineosporiaceae bacterium]|nr:GGDEF domain-containing protein [Kineosporiaceae bacterium]
MSPAGSGAGSSGRGAVEVAPLSQRVAAMQAFRLVMVAVLGVLVAVHSEVTATDGWVVISYLLGTGVLSATVLARYRSLALRAFSISLITDGIFVQLAHDRLGHQAAVDVVVAAQLVAVCLLASYRTGLKLAVWQSLLIVLTWRAQESGLLHFVQMAGVDRESAAIGDMVMLWLVVLTTSVAGAINERELRRRRYDAEALERLAAALLTDDTSAAVRERLRRFVVAELGAARAVVSPRAGEDGSGSAFLNLAATATGATLTLRLDPRRDRALDAALPGARRLAAIPLPTVGVQRELVFLVLDFGASRWRSARVERRVIASATQAAATAALAMARARLMEQAQRAAVTDGLTGVANRRAFDEALAGYERDWRERAVPFVLALIDVDHFKRVNDVHGHPVGDAVLAVVARVLTEQAGSRAFVARYGGEEFALVMPAMDTATAAVIADRVRMALPEAESPVRVTASIGVAGVPEDADGIQAVVRAADDALLLAKRTGRNRVVIAGPDTQAALLQHEAQSDRT